MTSGRVLLSRTQAMEKRRPVPLPLGGGGGPVPHWSGLAPAGRWCGRVERRRSTEPGRGATRIQVVCPGFRSVESLLWVVSPATSDEAAATHLASCFHSCLPAAFSCGNCCMLSVIALRSTPSWRDMHTVHVYPAVLSCFFVQLPQELLVHFSRLSTF